MYKAFELFILSVSRFLSLFLLFDDPSRNRFIYFIFKAAP